MLNVKMSKAICFCFLLILSAASAGYASSRNEEKEGRRQTLEANAIFEKVINSFLARSGSTSQVLSLNLSNLLILILLKALLFAAGSIGAGGWKGHGYGRSLEEENNEVVSDTEILLYLSYITGTPENYQCLQNVACRRPHLAMQYAEAGQILWKTAKVFNRLVDIDLSHEKALLDLKEASEYGLIRNDCDVKYPCSNKIA